jgi:hypothetical protein
MLIPFSCDVTTTFCGTPLTIHVEGEGYCDGPADGIVDFLDLEAYITHADGKPVDINIENPQDLLDSRPVWEQLVTAAEQNRADACGDEQDAADDYASRAREFNAGMFGGVWS